ncbi:MAG: AbrB family transcriptional regulator [Desulfurococcaceae archaeon]|nr:MAG: AbrB family transcriptional regulator [Desulfurococcaceae archaeon]
MECVSFEARVDRERLISIPKAAVGAVGISEGMRVRITVDDGRLIIEPVRDTIWYALHGSKRGYIGFEELGEGSMHKRGKIKNPG